MEAQIRIERTIVLTLTSEEAGWLHGYMQNALMQEREIDTQMRELFFIATDGGLE